MTLSDQFPGFEHAAIELNKFIATADIVTIMLKQGEIVHHSPKDMAAFIGWLRAHRIEDIKLNK